jgi:N-glycosylase/DNA lyase
LNKDYIKTDVKDFHLKEILECGQCFHFSRTDSGENPNKFEYDIAACGRFLHIMEEPSADGVKLTFYDTDEWEYEHIWKDYFDLESDYGEVKRRIIEADPRLEDIISENPGIRILNQEFFECLISFIISQNKQIPQIKQVVANLSSEIGTKFDVTMINRFSSEFDAFFPTVEQLHNATEDEIRASKCGFRAPYIIDATEKIYSGEITEDELLRLDTKDSRQLLMTIHGVGEKVANCALLFGLGRTDVFPVDVWMKRILAEEYPEGYPFDRYSPYNGIYQQYMFAWYRHR